MCMLDEIRAKREEIYAIARKHKAEKLWVFGSCARREERPDSDVDLLVAFSPHTTIFDYVRMQDSLSKFTPSRISSPRRTKPSMCSILCASRII